MGGASFFDFMGEVFLGAVSFFFRMGATFIGETSLNETEVSFLAFMAAS
jgi:hypothetical protein